ncbi:MAG TPA: beta-propeller fold lactonase family protein [Terracidiphilus sp.]|nr:beta-propeller fold lactonase family protein [Terracidiphilus sp.]
MSPKRAKLEQTVSRGLLSGVRRGSTVRSLARILNCAKHLTFAGVSLCALLLLAGCRPHDFPQYPANYREYAYVTNGGSGTVSVYDVVNVRLDREVQVGANPVAVVASPHRAEVYVVNAGVNNGQGSVSVLNAENNKVAATIPVHRHPVALALDPKGAFAYVANSASNNVSVLDLKARREVAAIGAGEEPAAVRVAPDGKTLVVANRRGDSVSLVDPASGRVRAVFEGCPGASDIAILPDSSKAFVACSAGHQIMAIALARFGQPGAPQADRLEALLDVGRAPVELALKPDGGEIFVSNSLSDTISEVITGTDDVLGAYLMGDDPVLGLVSSDNSLLYVGNLRSQEVTIYAIEDGKRAGTIHVGDGPAALAFSAAGHLLFVVDSRSGDVAVVRTASVRAATNSGVPLPLFTILPAGRDPNAIAVKGFRLQ